MSPTYPFDHPHTENPGPGRRAPSTKKAAAATFRPLDGDQRDTAAGCRDRASADLLEAAKMATVNARAKMESSAANWTLRAELLDRLEASFDARKVAAAARDEEPLRS